MQNGLVESFIGRLSPPLQSMQEPPPISLIHCASTGAQVISIQR